MKTPWRILLLSLYLIVPIPGLLLYNVGEAFAADLGWGASIALGIEAWTIYCLHLFLATRPWRWHERAGTAFYQGLHALGAVLLFLMAIAHRVIKLTVLGYPENFQTLWGALAIGAFTLVILVGILALSPQIRLAAVLRFRSWVKDKARLDFKRWRAIHALVVIAGGFLIVHVALAASTQSSPWGFAWLLGLLAVALGRYGYWRLKNRGSPPRQASISS